MAEWKKNPKKKKKYVGTKVPTVKLCLDCKQPTNRRNDRCTRCEKFFNEKRSRRTEKDEEYRLALLKHVL